MILLYKNNNDDDDSNNVLIVTTTVAAAAALLLMMVMTTSTMKMDVKHYKFLENVKNNKRVTKIKMFASVDKKALPARNDMLKPKRD